MKTLTADITPDGRGFVAIDGQEVSNLIGTMTIMVRAGEPTSLSLGLEAASFSLNVKGEPCINAVPVNEEMAWEVFQGLFDYLSQCYGGQAKIAAMLKNHVTGT